MSKKQRARGDKKARRPLLLRELSAQSTGNGSYIRCVRVWLCLRNDAFPFLARYDTRPCAAGIPHYISDDSRGHDDRRPQPKQD
jgi:hypothetical protein